MLNNKNSVAAWLSRLGLSSDEAVLYVELLQRPLNHLQLARATGINRTKVYRLAAELEKRSLITKRVDDQGTSLIVTDPATLEVELVGQEEKLKARRKLLNQLLPILESVQKGGKRDFAIQTFEGASGIKQMLWHELKTKGEICIYTSGDIGLVTGGSWAERYRRECLERKIPMRWIENRESTHLEVSKVDAYGKMLVENTRRIDKKILKIGPEITIHDNTVSIYNSWDKDAQLGVEIASPLLADFMRQIFEQHWDLAKPNERKVK